MLDHVGLPVSDYQRSKSFYAACLKPLGFELMFEVASKETKGASQAGFGSGSKTQFWIGQGEPVKGRVHFAFSAADRGAVDAFYAAAIKAGGKDNGAPGLRLHYHENYYSAFVFDPDGHNIEAVCHKPE